MAKRIPGLEMIWCPAGTFLMGSPADEARRGADEIQHPVVLTQGFWIAKYPVTQDQWKKLMGRNPSRFRECGLQAPVEQVNWHEAMEFCRRLSGREKSPYTLPTEAQWEYACRAGTVTPFHFGSILDGSQANCLGDYPYGTSVKGPSLGKTTPVGRYGPNPWGICDMHGNVWEWCLDGYRHYPSVPATNPKGPEQSALRVIRGGSWDEEAAGCRSAFRDCYEPARRHCCLGFRPVSPGGEPA